MFHIGILMVIGGHVVGLLIPRAWLEAVGVTEHAYHLVATWVGTIAAVLTLAGLAILIYRRRTVGPVFLATTRMDKLMYVVLGATLAFGTAATVMFQVLGDAYDYRGSIVAVDPRPADVPARPLADGRRAARRSSCTSCAPSPCSACGRSPGSCTCSPRRSGTSRGRTSSTGPGTPTRLGSRTPRRGWERAERPGARR